MWDGPESWTLTLCTGLPVSFLTDIRKLLRVFDLVRTASAFPSRKRFRVN